MTRTPPGTTQRELAAHRFTLTEPEPEPGPDPETLLSAFLRIRALTTPRLAACPKLSQRAAWQHHDRRVRELPARTR